MNGWKVIVHGVSRTPPKSTKFELQKHTCHSQELWSKVTRFIDLALCFHCYQLKTFPSLSESFSLVFLLLLTSLDFSLPDSLGIFNESCT